jgi:hypothetical protein
VRDAARELARAHYAAGDPTGWFDALYLRAGRDYAVIPWADRRPNPNLTMWCKREGWPRADLTALVPGCGLGDDAEYLASLGAQVTAFDISPEAIAWCRERFPSTRVSYVVGDIQELPEAWRGRFDCIAECYTLQALPDAMRGQAIDQLAIALARGGRLLTVSRGRDMEDPPGELPWPLTEQELDRFKEHGLRRLSFEDYEDPEERGKRRFRSVWTRD